MKARSSVAVVALALASCGSGIPTGASAMPPVPNAGTRLPSPDGGINGIAALRDRLVIGLLSSSDTTFHVWTMGLDGSDPRELALRSLPDPGVKSTPAESCRQVTYLHPVVIGADLVAINRTCATDPEVAGFAAFFSVEALDLATGTLTQLSAPQAGVNPGPTTWNPDHTRGLAAQGDGSCNTLVWLTASGTSSVHWTIDEAGKRWNMADSFNGTCDSQGLAALPAWSPDGKVVAFAGSLAAIGVHGLNRGFQPWNIYLNNPSKSSPSVLLRNLHDLGDLGWSHDGQRLAFSGTLADGRTGTWTTDLRGGLTQVSGARAEYLAWSGTDDAIFMAVDVSGQQLADRSELRIIPAPKPSASPTN